MDVFEEIAAVLYPMPREDEVPEEVFNDLCWEVDGRRKAAVQQMEAAWDGGEIDPLLGALADARARKEAAEEEIRQLLAYGREFTRPRPYTLGGLASAAGMSISGVRTGYDHDHIAAVAAAIGRPSRDWRATDPPDDTPEGPNAKE